MTLARRLLSVAGSGGGIIAPDNGFDEEFNGGMGDWVAPDLGFGTADINTTSPGEAYMPVGTALHRVGLPTPPFTVTARCTFLQYLDIDASFGNASLGLAEASPATSPGPKMYVFQWDIAFLGEIGAIDGYWEQYVDTPTHLGPYVKLGDGDLYEIPHWQRLVVNSFTDIDTYYSTDGINWITYDTGTNPGFTPGAVVLLSYGCTTRWDWVRFT